MMKDLLRELKSFTDPKKAIASKNYHKSEREHWGVTTPQCGLIAKKFSKDLEQKELIALAKALWETDLFDPMICASKVLSSRKIEASPLLWKTIKSFLKSVDGWALEDTLAPVAWKCILADKTLLDDLEGWTKHRNFWMRRAALVYTLPFAKRGHDPERMLGWAASYASDPEWFIQKAIGWWLRVLGEHNPERVVLFLNDHWTELKGVARKEATRKLPAKFQKLFR